MKHKLIIYRRKLYYSVEREEGEKEDRLYNSSKKKGPQTLRKRTQQLEAKRIDQVEYHGGRGMGEFGKARSIKKSNKGSGRKNLPKSIEGEAGGIQPKHSQSQPCKGKRKSEQVVLLSTQGTRGKD